MASILEDTYEKAMALAGAGDEAGARNLIAERFLAFPEDLQGKILALTYIEALEHEAGALATRADLLKRGISALDILDELRTKIEREISEKKN